MDLSPEGLLTTAMFLVPMILSLSVHEYAHAAVANHLGDDTARLQGRMTLNPIAHIDPVGTLLLPLLGIPFGWAKPVPVNPARFSPAFSLKMSLLLVAAAGPISNIILAAFALTALYLQGGSMHAMGSIDDPIMFLCVSLVTMNIALAIFNMLPIPPLDGSKVLDALVPDSCSRMWQTFQRYSHIALIAVILSPMLIGVSPIWFVLKKVLDLFP